MPVALNTAVPPSQSRQRVGTRLVRRLGGAVRSAIGSAINLARAVRRPAVSRHHAAAQAPAPSRVRVPRPRHAPSTSPALRAWAAKQTKAPTKQAAEGAAPLPLPWLAHLLARRQHRLAATSRPAWPNQGDIHFTPQAFPQLSAKACAVLNTPLKDCDPKTLRLLVSTFTQHINQVMSPEAGITDPAAAFPNLLHRLNAALADTNADASLSITPPAVPATPADAVPDAPPQPPAQAPTTAPTTQWTNHAPRLSPLPPSGPPASDQPADATTTAAAPATTPDNATPCAPLVHRSRSFRYHTRSFARRRGRHVRRCRAPFPRGVRDGRRCLPPPWRLYYAACTGPP